MRMSSNQTLNGIAHGFDRSMLHQVLISSNDDPTVVGSIVRKRTGRREMEKSREKNRI